MVCADDTLQEKVRKLTAEVDVVLVSDPLDPIIDILRGGIIVDGRHRKYLVYVVTSRRVRLPFANAWDVLDGRIVDQFARGKITVYTSCISIQKANKANIYSLAGKLLQTVQTFSGVMQLSPNEKRMALCTAENTWTIYEGDEAVCAFEQTRVCVISNTHAVLMGEVLTLYCFETDEIWDYGRVDTKEPIQLQFCKSGHFFSYVVDDLVHVVNIHDFATTYASLFGGAYKLLDDGSVVTANVTCDGWLKIANQQRQLSISCNASWAPQVYFSHTHIVVNFGYRKNRIIAFADMNSHALPVPEGFNVQGVGEELIVFSNHTTIQLYVLN